MRGIILFPVLISSFPSLKVNFEHFGKNRRHLVKDVFSIIGLGVGGLCLDILLVTCMIAKPHQYVDLCV